MNLHDVRRRLARWIYPEGCACEKKAPSPRTRELLMLAEAFVRYHGFAEFTHLNILTALKNWIKPNHFYVEKWKFSNNITRLLKHPSTCPRDKTYHSVIQVFANNWPADLPWPSDIPRPPSQPPRPGGHPSRGGEQLPAHPYRDVGGRAVSGTKAEETAS